MVNNHRCQVILIAPTPTASSLMLKAKRYGTLLVISTTNNLYFKIWISISSLKYFLSLRLCTAYRRQLFLPNCQEYTCACLVLPRGILQMSLVSL